MGARIIPDIPCAKGWVPYGLDQCSRGRGARSRLQRLNESIASLAPRYQGLETVFDTHLLSHIISNSEVRKKVVEHLKMHWFDVDSPAAFFPGQPVAQIYAQGVLKAVELSLNGQRTVPIDTWWVLDSQAVKMLTLADIDEQGKTLGRQVTLLILTPKPPPPRADEEVSTTPILGYQAEAWVSEQVRAPVGRPVETLRVKDILQN
jgi:hypothetical protein